MDIEGQERIAAPRDIVWRALNDAETIRQCIPGCERLEWISDNELAASIKVRFSLISLGLAGTITLSNIDAGESYTLSAEGQGSIAGFAKGAADVRLEEDGTETVLHYIARAQTGGRISQLGSKLVRSTTEKLAAKFFADFNAAVIAKTAEARTEGL
ncbi:carbon monoxide dehydrogenase [Rhizobium sp. Leaf306]|uniref:CoxG family protein n=1 Tax=Rhizobium sp. Leaf306 TaxID=1736330 RepID=UPI00071363B5|nr:carbon monoxide dehydrogenase subunit G [Rhizobium sp. Leaf306]KQQ38407.1 carbon monoxide dehydrogenase [Rhizobium sp. Leaf306]